MRDSIDLLDNLPVIIWTAGVDGRICSAAGEALRAAGLGSADLSGRPAEMLFPAAADSIREAHREALAGRRSRFTADRRGRDYEALLEPLRNPDGSIAGVAGAAIDVTGRVVADRAIRLSEQSYRSLIEEAPYAIFRATLSGQLLQVNRAMREILGYRAFDEADLLMRDLPGIFADPGGFEDFRDRLLASGVNEAVDSAWKRRDGAEVQVRVSGRGVRDGAGRAMYLDILAENVTEKKHLEAQLGQAQKMQALGQLAGGVAHDFNNLLMVIGGQVEMILCEAIDSEVEGRLNEIRQAADRAAALTRQLLAFSRRQVLQCRTLDLNEVIRRTARLLARLIRENVRVEFTASPEPMLVRADPNQIEQVLMNLAINAQDAMPAGGSIAISTVPARVPEPEARQMGFVEPGEYARIVFADTGHGMDASTMTRIFEPFFTTKGLGQGTGLGLSMVYGVVRQSGGQIRVDSKPGAGTRFTIDLPLVGEADACPVEAGPALRPRGAETILLVEDEDSVRKLVETYLGHLGYRVFAADNGVAALEMLNEHGGEVRLVITDVVMPGMGGYELASAVRSRMPGIGILFISGYAGQAISAADLEESGARLLQKPFSMDALARTVREALDGAAKAAAI